MNRIAHRPGRSVGTLGLLLGALLLSGCALQTGTGEDGHEGSAASASTDDPSAAAAPGSGEGNLLLGHLVAAPSATPTASPAPLRNIPNPQDPQPSPWVGTNGTSSAAPVDRQQLGVTVEQH